MIVWLRHWAPVIAFLAVAIVSTIGVYLARTAAEDAVRAVEQAETVADQLAARVVERAQENAAELADEAVAEAEQLAAEAVERAERLAADNAERSQELCDRSAEIRRVILDLLAAQGPPPPVPPGADAALTQAIEEAAARQAVFLTEARERLAVPNCADLVDVPTS